MSDSHSGTEAQIAPPVVSAAGKRHYGAKRVRRSVKHYLYGRGITAVASFAVALLLVRELSIADYAAYTAISGLLIGLMIFSNGGLERVIPRYFPELRLAGAEKELWGLCWTLFGVRFLLLIVILTPVALAYEWLSQNFGLPNDRALMWTLCAYVLAFGMQQHLDHCLQALMAQRTATQANAIDWFGKLFALGGWYLYFGGLPLTACIAIQAATAVMASLFSLIRLIGHLRENPDTGARVLDPRRVFRMAAYSYLLPMAGFHAAPSAGKLLSAYLLPGAATAMVGFAQSFTQFMKRNLPAKLMLGVIEPTIMARYAETRDFSQTVRFVGIVLKLNLFVLMPVGAWVALNGKPVIELFTGGKYGDAAWLVGCFMLILVMESHRLILHLITNAVDETPLLLHSNLMSMVFLPLTIVGALTLGLPGLIACLLAISFSRNYFVVRGLRVKGYYYAPDWRGIARISILAALSSLAAYVFLHYSGTGVPYVIGSLLLSALLYLALCLRFKPFSQIERDTVNGFLGKRYFFL
ncbi:MAG TPA: hypothetical protein VJM53_00540 [Burkholderiales bacterium]|nr:hypothetical protein [Burkholderiales bacterium]